MSGLIAEVRWHGLETSDLSDYEGWIETKDRPAPMTWRERWRRFLQKMSGRKPVPHIPAHGYEASTNRTACFFDVVLGEPLPLARYAAYWGYVDSVVREDGFHLGDGWPLPSAILAFLLPLIGYHFRVINPRTILLSCWIDGKPEDLEPVLARTKQLLGFAPA